MNVGYWLGLLSGLLMAAVSALFAGVLQRVNEKHRKREEARFAVYMRLLDVHSLYFWVTAAEVHGENADPSVWDRLRSEAWQIADTLREADNIKELDVILDVLFADRYSTSTERAKVLDDVIQQMADRVNARYSKVMRDISRENILGFGQVQNRVSNAPGRPWPP